LTTLAGPLHRVSVVLLLGLGAAVFLLPFAFALSTGLKPATQLFVLPIQWFARPFAWSNFMEGWHVRPFSTFLGNTIIVTALATAGNVLSSSLVAYGFARLRFPGRDLLFLVLLATLMVPSQVTIIPLFWLYNAVGWLDTFLPLVVPSYFSVHPFYVFLLRQFMLGIPVDLEDAAKIDGCSAFGIYRHVVLPLCKPAVATVALFSFVNTWNDFFDPLIFLNSEHRKTLTLGLVMFRGIYDQEWHLLMAITVLLALPCVLVFLLTQRYFIEGVTITGMKG
jgi:ABC-type glycerol-3-phosphate transport system permease component